MDYRQWPPELVADARRNSTIGGGLLPKKVLFGSDFIYAASRPFAPTRVLVEGRAPLPTFAQGGFSTVWGGAALPVDDCDITDWPIHRSELAPFYARHGMRWQTYSGLLYGWLVENRAPHTDWSRPAESGGVRNAVAAAGRAGRH